MTVPARLPGSVASPSRAGDRRARPRLFGSLDERLRLVADTWIPDRQLSPIPLWLLALTTTSLFGLRFGGPVPLAATWIGGLLVPAVGPTLARHREERAARRLLPERCTSISRAVRAGAPLTDAVEEAFPVGSPGAPRWRSAIEQVGRGRPFDEALRALPTGSGSESLLVSGLRIGWGSGGPVAAGLEVLSARLRDATALDDRRRVLTAQARTSATVLAVLPVAFALVLSAMRGAPLWSGAPAHGAAGAGALLNLLGVVWMRRLLRGAS